MDFDFKEIVRKKKLWKKQFSKKMWWEKNIRGIIWVHLTSQELFLELSRACEAIGLRCVDTKSLGENFLAVDACVSEFFEDFSLCQEFAMAPIFSEEIDAVKEFHPMKFEGNGFVFSQKNVFVIFEKICRFLENTSYPWDHRQLFKNIIFPNKS